MAGRWQALTVGDRDSLPCRTRASRGDCKRGRAGTTSPSLQTIPAQEGNTETRWQPGKTGTEFSPQREGEIMNAVLQDVGTIDRRTIPGVEGRYLATADGRIWSTKTQRFMAASVRRDGYFYVILRITGRYVNFAVHRLVASAWIRAPLAGEQVNHLNLVKTDNRAVNLEWCTPRENSVHAWQTLPPETIAYMRERRSFGALKMNRMKRRLDFAAACAIRSAVKCGKRRVALAEQFGVSRTTIDSIVNWKIYRD